MSDEQLLILFSKLEKQLIKLETQQMSRGKRLERFNFTSSWLAKINKEFSTRRSVK
jgi:hypothetical protein